MFTKALTFLLLQGNILFLYQQPKELPINVPYKQEIQGYPVYKGEDIKGLSSEIIFHYNQEPRGPHVWLLSGKLTLELKNEKVSSDWISFRYTLTPRLYVVRIAPYPTWQKSFGTEEYDPLWAKIQLTQNQPEVSKFLYELTAVQGEFRLRKSLFAAEHPVLQALQNAGSEMYIPLNDSFFPEKDKDLIIQFFRSMLKDKISAHWHSSGLFLWLKKGPFDDSAIHIHLGDYSYRWISGKIQSVETVVSPYPPEDIFFLRTKEGKIHFSWIASQKEHHAPLDLPFTLDSEIGKIVDSPKPLDNKQIDSANISQKASIYLQRLNQHQGMEKFILSIGQHLWVIQKNGESVWHNQRKALPDNLLHKVDIPAGKGLLYIESKDFYRLSPQSENLVYFRIYVNKEEIGRTTPTIGSRKKDFHVALEPGKHLLAVERWELVGEEYVKSRKILQPQPMYIVIEKGYTLWINLFYRSNQKIKMEIYKP